MNMLKVHYNDQFNPSGLKAHMCVSGSRFMRSMYAGTPFTGKKVTQIFNPRRGQGLNLGPLGWKAEILYHCATPPLG